MNEPSARPNDSIPTGEAAGATNREWTNPRELLRHFAFAIAMAASIGFARLFSIPYEGGIVTTIWPATGIALGVMLRFGARSWFALALGNGLALYSIGLEPTTFLVTWGIDSLFPLAVVALLSRVDFDPRLTRTRDVLTLGLGVALGLSTIPAAIQTAAYAFDTLESPTSGSFLPIAVEWWLEGAMGILVFTPLLLVVTPSELIRMPRLRRFEGVALMLAAFSLTVAVFRGLDALSPYGQVASLLAFPLAMLAAFRFGKAGAALLSTACALGAVLGRSGVSARLAGQDIHSILIDQTSFLIVVSLFGLVMAVMLLRRIGTELLLASTQNSFRSLFLHSPIGIAIERAGVIRFVNRALLRTLGHAHPEELIGRVEADWIEFGAPTRREGERDAVCRRADGSRVEVRVTEAAIPQVDGVEIVRFVTDQTERRTLENELQRSRRLESVGLLAGGIAHDFNNLLTVIAGYVDLLRETTPKDSDRAAPLDHVAAATEKASALTRQLLAFGRAKGASGETLDLSAKCGELAPILRRLVGENVELVLELEPDLPRVSVDPTQLDQILLNLVTNARDAMRDGGRLTVRTRSVRVDAPNDAADPAWRSGESVVLEVEDTGAGMDEETKQRAFDPFFTTKPAGKGSGIGLATVHSLAVAAGARIRLESRLGSGTRVAIGFPVPPRRKHAAGGVGAETVQAAEGASILVVQDDPALRGLISQVLVRESYRVKAVASAPEALESLAQQAGRCDLLITDVMMPRMSGAELARCVRRHWPMVRCLFLSGYSEPELLAIQREIEPDELLSKPFTTAQLLERVRASMG